MKKRLDLILVQKKIAETRTKAQNMITSGNIYINGKLAQKSSDLYSAENKIILKKLDKDWVSKGAFKLLHALDYFKIDVFNFKCLDIGASTGGFSQVLLSRNANKIYSVDVGTNQMSKKLLNNPKIINIQKTNARYINKEIIPEIIDIIVCDVSFISMKKVIEPSLSLLDDKFGIIIGLIKPQFESSKNEVGKGGVVKDDKIHKRICLDFENWFISKCKMKVLGIIQSPIKSPKGNIEFLICAKRNA